MHEAIAAQLAWHIGIESSGGIAVHIGYAATRLFDDDFGWCHVVAGWSAENTCGKFSRRDEAREIVNRETRNDRDPALVQFVHDGEKILDVPRLANANERLFDRSRSGHMNWFPILESTLAFFGPVGAIFKRIHDDAEDRLASMEERERKGRSREAMREIVRAIHRVEDPYILVRFVVITFFFGEDAVIGKMLFHLFENHRVDCKIGLRDGRAIILPYLSHACREVLPHHDARRLGEIECDIKVGCSHTWLSEL